MSTYGYVRSSTEKQDHDNQRYGILTFANSKQLGNVNFVEETVSGRVTWGKRELAKVIGVLQPGDVLVVTELSRLGRSLLEIMELLSMLTRRQVKVYAIKGDYELGPNLQSKVLAFAFGLAAEIERELISARTKEALARKKAEGVVLGRPVGSIGKSKLDGSEEEIKLLLRHGVAKAAIARLKGISRPALYDFIASRRLWKK